MRWGCQRDASNSSTQIADYGFIAPDGGESDVFVHISAVEVAGMDTLVAGQLLAYDIGTARDGRSKAINLRLLNPDGHYGGPG